MSKNRNIDWSRVDYRSLTQTQRLAVTQAAIDQAHRERGEFLAAQMIRLGRLPDRAVDWVLRAVFAPKIPARPSRCA